MPVLQIVTGLFDIFSYKRYSKDTGVTAEVFVHISIYVLWGGTVSRFGLGHIFLALPAVSKSINSCRLSEGCLKSKT